MIDKRIDKMYTEALEFIQEMGLMTEWLVRTEGKPPDPEPKHKLACNYQRKPVGSAGCICKPKSLEDVIDNDLKLAEKDGLGFNKERLISAIRSWLVERIEKISWTTIEAYPKTEWVRKTDLLAMLSEM